MKFSPKRTDSAIRAIYAGLLLASLLFAGTGQGILKAILTSVALLTLTGSIYLFIRYDLTTYTYIIKENGESHDFYIDKSVGKRGGYVCYYPVSDIVLIEKYGKDTKKRLRSKYGKVNFYNYSQNIIKANKSVILFKNDGYHDAVIFEPDDNFTLAVNSAMDAYACKIQNENDL